MSPMNATIQYQQFASSIAMNTHTPPNTRVSEDGMYITYNDKTLSISKWRSGLRRLADEVTKELDDLCLNDMFGLHISDDIFDDWGNEDRGYSWTKNGEFTDNKRSLLAAMLRDPSSRLAKINEAGEFEFNIAEVWDFLHKCDRVNEKLSLLSYFTPGQTPRVTEFTEHKFANSTRPRTMFHDHLIWLATRRLKTESRTEKAAFIPMKCYPELTKLLERYFLIVRPVEAELVKVVRDEEHYHTFTEYMWTKDCKPITAEGLRKSILECTTKYFDSPIGTREYRQICVEIGRVFVGSEFEIKEEEMDALASQAGHSIDMTRLRYASEEGMVPSMSSDLLARFGRVSEAWWEVTGFRPGYPPMLPLRVRQDLRAAAPIAAQPVPLVSNPQPSTVDNQAVILGITSFLTAEIQKLQHSLGDMVRKSVAEAMIPTQYPHMGKPNPALPQPPPVVEDQPMDEVRPFSPPPVTEDQSMEGVRPSSPLDSSLAITEGEEEDMYGLTRDHPEFDPPIPVLEPAITTEMLDAMLRRHFPHYPDPTFKSPQQKQAVRLSVERQQNFVAVLPTGGGKSLTYTLPTFNPKEEGYRSYIIVPSRALLQDQIKRSEDLGLEVMCWTAKKPAVEENIQLVFLAMESATSPSFKK
jgi:hypothetical protein